MITIKHRFSGTTLCEFDVETVKLAVETAVKDGADLRGANLYGANLRGADLYGANLYGADLYGADLYGADLRSANLRGADLRGANLRGADLYGADLEGSDLYGADLYGANLRGADLYGANLYGADLYGADLEGEKITKSPLSVVGLRYWCLISDGYMRLGCKRFKHAEWVNFTDEEISDMDEYALEFWSQWKAPLLAMCAAHAVKSGE